MRAKTYKVAFYCPDKHLTYNLHTLDYQGIGGGITARIRVAHALADLGHIITIYNNCPQKQVINNVQYLPYDQVREIETDIFIASTSGDRLNLESLQHIETRTRLQVLMTHGVDPPIGIELTNFDYIYALSNFVRKIAVDSWGIQGRKLFTTHRGVKEEYYQIDQQRAQKRDPFSIVYIGHPSKGLLPAIEILEYLLQSEPKFSLHVYGGYELWGEKEKSKKKNKNLYYYGLIGQRELAREIQKYNYALFIQDREEPLGISLLETLKAGSIVLASQVGAFPEIINHGHNGFLIKGKSTEVSTKITASRIMLDLLGNSGYCSYIRRNAIATPFDWKRIAETWSAHWDWALDESSRVKPIVDLGLCQSCKSHLLLLADGTHCIGCGRYRQGICL